MKGKAENIIFVVLCLILCVLPFAGMTVARTDTTTENTKLAGFPALRDEDGFNVNILQELGAYFEDHFAFREALVNADSIVQSRVFRVSDMERVIVGDDGWLYYTDTLDDYLGRNVMSGRAAHNAVHNLALLERYVEGQGADFVFTIAPNKNSLYGENMPYYYEKKAGDTKNLNLISPLLASEEIAYCDLFGAFAGEDEVLYLKRDSHWNEKGALLAYNRILDALGYEHETYETTPAVRTKTEYGDLNKMIYPLWGEPEWNYQYKYESSFRYVAGDGDVEAARIETVNDGKDGSLLMFRDSFGNTLLPFFAEAFGKAYFSKGEPYAIETYMEEYSPKTVIVEKVERNLWDFASNPPLMTGPVVEDVPEAEKKKTGTTVRITDSETNTAYWEIRGVVDEDYIEDDSRIYVSVAAGDDVTVYEAFAISDGAADNGYLLYLPKDELAADTVTVGILAEKGGRWTLTAERELSLTETAKGEGK